MTAAKPSAFPLRYIIRAQYRLTKIVQLYIRQRGTSVARPVRELKGFQRITLAPGQSRRVEFTLGRDELRFWNINMKNVVEPAEVTVWIAPDSTGRHARAVDDSLSPQSNTCTPG